MSHVPTGCVLAQVAVSNDWHPRAPGGRSPGIIPLRRGWSHHLVPLFREMLMRPEAFLGLPGACGFPSGTRTHLKNILVPYLYTWWGAYKKYIKMSHKIIAIRDNTSLNVIKRNKKKLAGRIKKFKKDKQGQHI